MPPRRRAPSESLTPSNLETLAGLLADGKRATVYLCEGVPSLGLARGASGRVISISGSTLTVKPNGVDDELPFEADELRMTKIAPPQQDKVKASASTPKPAAAVARPTPQATPAAVRASPPTPTPTPTKPKPATPKKTAARKAPASVLVTIFGSAENEWSVTVTRGARKPTRSRTVTPDSVEAAMHGLADEAAIEAASSVLTAAREEAQRRVEELSRELAAAQEALAALEGGK